MYVYKSVCNCVILEGLNCKRYTNIQEGTERDRESVLQKFPQNHSTQGFCQPVTG